MSVHRLRCRVAGQGLHEITKLIEGGVRDAVQEAGLTEGLCTLYLRHTSASLTIQENADPAVCRDLENWMNRLVIEEDPLYTHKAEGPDDMPAHIKSALTATSLSIPILDSRLTLGTWQGIFLWEHRYARGDREVVLHVGA
ncbi:MAG: secondary thiamine-phosphate synthase enzyme YjbQ [Candidatus Binatia bacterium]|nr:secondary thiamine-phosphate synthase enzyme YjbQ [Candidatus Binatia bacterium]